jgi:hypothetical protein
MVVRCRMQWRSYQRLHNIYYMQRPRRAKLRAQLAPPAGYTPTKVKLQTGPRGRGVVTKRRIQSRTLITRYPVEVTADPCAITTLLPYLVEVLDSRLVGKPHWPSVKQPASRGIANLGPWVNDCDKTAAANAILVASARKGRRHLPGTVLMYDILATRTIETGEEVLIDYGKSYGKRPWK